MISRTSSRGTSRSTRGMAPASFSVGMTTAIPGRPLASAGAAMGSETPAQAAVLARERRRIAEEARAKGLIGGAVPDFPQGLLGGVAERVAVVAARGEGGDTAGERAAVGGE